MIHFTTKASSGRLTMSVKPSVWIDEHGGIFSVALLDGSRNGDCFVTFGFWSDFGILFLRHCTTFKNGNSS